MRTGNHPVFSNNLADLIKRKNKYG